MIDALKQDFRYHPAFAAAIFIALILFWTKLYIDVPLDVDIGWLLQCLDWFLAGGSYTQDFYETNPPLSFLIYLPAYPLYTFLGVDAQIAVLVCFFGYIALANVVVFKMLRAEHIAIIAGLLIAQTWAMGISFGSKDHLVFIFLPVLCLFQHLITRHQTPRALITIACVIMGGIAVSLKPHYAIIPALFFVHRLYVTRSLLICVKSPDFIGLLVFGLLYLIFITIFSPSFWDILPIVASLYSVEQPFPLTSRLFYLVFAALSILCSFFIKNKDLKIALYFAAGLSALCLAPYLLQNKGFHYHALPMLGFAMSALFLGVYGATKHLTAHKDFRLCISAGFIALLCTGYVTGGKRSFQTDGQFMAQPLIDTIDELAWNRTYMCLDFKCPLSALPYMSDLRSGFRFGQVWPLYGLSEQHKIAQNDEQRVMIKSKMLDFVDLIAEDIERYEPSVITIPQYKDPATGEPTQNFYNFLIQNERFRKNMQNYDFEDTLNLDISFTSDNIDQDKIIPHDVYILKKNHEL